MLFLFKGELKGAFPLPLEQWMGLVLKQAETLVSYKEQGKILAGGPAADSRAGYFIFEVDSIEELQRLVRQLPLFPFADSELIPLITPEQALESAKQMQASVRKAKK